MLTDTMRIEILRPEHLQAQLDLQSRVLRSMEKGFFLADRDADVWAKILNSRDYAVYGIFDDDKLIASGTVHFPNGVDPRDLPEFTPAPEHDLAIFMAAMVDPDHRGHGLLRLLQEMRQGAAIKRKRNKIICKISTENIISWKVTINNGFHGVKVAVDASRHEKMYLIKKLRLISGNVFK